MQLIFQLCINFFFRPLIITSLILISIGNGSIRACVTSLGGSQFTLPNQSKSLDRYFSHYYFVYTFGILLSKIITPEIRERTQCFGQNECYAAVFGTLIIIFLAAWSKKIKYGNSFLAEIVNFFLSFSSLHYSCIFARNVFL